MLIRSRIRKVSTRGRFSEARCKKRRGMKRDALDALFSLFIRQRDKWTCQRCGKRYPEKSQGLHCAHIFSRAKKSVRYYPDNATVLCFPCHTWMDQHTTEKHAWWRARIGEDRWAKLLLKMSIPAKVDGAMVKRWLEQELEEMGK